MLDEILIESENIIKKALRTNPPQRHFGNECVLIPVNDFNRFRTAVRKLTNLKTLNQQSIESEEIDDDVYSHAFEMPSLSNNDEFLTELLDSNDDY